MAVYGVLLWLLLSLHRIVWLNQPINAQLLLRHALFSVIVSAIINGLGWLSARLLWLITSAGTVIGMGIMYSYTYREMSGWEDLSINNIQDLLLHSMSKKTLVTSFAFQPHFRNQPEHVKVFWGYGMYPDKVGDFVKKKMCACTGEEIMEELIGHLHF